MFVSLLFFFLENLWNFLFQAIFYEADSIDENLTMVAIQNINKGSYHVKLSVQFRQLQVTLEIINSQFFC